MLDSANYALPWDCQCHARKFARHGGYRRITSRYEK